MEKNANKKVLSWKFGFSALLLIIGIVFNLIGIGKNYFMGYGSVGNYLIFCGALIAFIAVIKSFAKPKIIDEREVNLSYKATRITFVAMMILAFVIIIADGIKTINYPFGLFMSYFVCTLLLIYVASYYIMLKYR